MAGSAIGRRYRAFVLAMEPDRKNASHPRDWAIFGAFIAALLAVVAYVPGVREAFGLSFGTSLLCFAPCFLLGSVGGWLTYRERISLSTYVAIALVTASAMHFFGAAMVALASPPGDYVMGALLIVAVAGHGYMHRLSFRYPFQAVGSALGIAAGAALSPEAAPTVAVTGFAALGAGLAFGMVSLRTDELTRQHEELRAALQAQLLEESARDQERLTTLLQQNHDAKNVLSSVFLQSQLLAERTTATGHGGTDLAAVTRLARGVVEGLDKLKQLLEARAHDAPHPAALEPVQVDFALEEAIADVRALHPDVAIELLDARDALGLSIPVAGGHLALHRMLENVLRNACEGDGRRGARRVRVMPREQRAEGQLAIHCVDDGPGFPEEQLRKPIGAFDTTKPTGTGLGLLTAQRLAHASGGSLERANEPAGGARVTLALALAPDR